MVLPDDGDDEMRRSGPPLPPEDRLWRHPSELDSSSPRQVSARPGRRVPAGVVVMSGVLGAVAAVAVLSFAGVLGSDDAQPSVVERVEAATAGDLTTAAERAIPSVVHLETTRPEGSRLGSAVAIRDDGHLLTTADLVDGADSMTALLDDGTRVTAEVVGLDRSTDLAVVRIDADPPGIVIGSANDLEEGELILGVSSALGESGPVTVTQGVIRRVGVRLDDPAGPALYDLIEASDDIGALPQGSVLLDQTGALVGLVTARSRSGTEDGGVPHSYATPIEYARHVAGELIETGDVAHPWLGVEAGDDPTRDVEPTGAVIDSVADRGPADAAGLEAGDVITAIEGEPVEDMDDLVVRVRVLEPGDSVRLEYWREGNPATCEVVLERWHPRPST